MSEPPKDSKVEQFQPSLEDFLDSVSSAAKSDVTSKNDTGKVNRIDCIFTRYEDYGIRLRPANEESFEFYVDADWGGDPATRRSTTGYLIKYMGGPLVAVSRR